MKKRNGNGIKRRKGLTKREHFASMIMQALCSINYKTAPFAGVEFGRTVSIHAKNAIIGADALLTELKGGKK